MEINIENSLRRYLPIIFELLGEPALNSREWKKINKKFTHLLVKRKEQFAANNEFLIVEMSLYDLIVEALKGTEIAICMLNLIKMTMEELIINVSFEDRKKLRPTIYNLLLSFNLKYNNYLAELLVLNSLARTGFRLVEVESIISGNKSADFLISNVKNNETYLIEVVSIHLHNDMQDLARFINGKLADKYDDKTKSGLGSVPIIIIPVIWSTYDTLLKVADLIANRLLFKTQVINEPTAFAMFKYSDGSYVMKFGKISTLIDISQEH